MITEYIKKTILALCVGLIAAFVYDAFFPKYEYYNHDRKLITKEVYFRDIHEDEYGSSQYIKRKVASNESKGLGGAVLILVLVVDPLNRKKNK